MTDSTAPAPGEAVTIQHDPERGIDVIHLPDVPYYDTQVWAVDVGLTRESVVALRNALDEWHGRAQLASELGVRPDQITRICGHDGEEWQ